MVENDRIYHVIGMFRELEAILFDEFTMRCCITPCVVALRLVVLSCVLSVTVRCVAMECHRNAYDAITPVHRLDWSIWRQRYNSQCTEIRTGRHFDVVFVGDSIMHYWERDHKQSWERWMGRYNPLNLGILADQTQHVLWRLTEGGQLEGYGPKAFVVLVGTNNIGNNPPGAEKPEWVVAGIKKIVETIRRKHGGAPILLMAILPRSRDNDIKCGYPKANAQVNELLRKLADGKSVHWLDCGRRFVGEEVRDGTPIVDLKLMADSLHPTEKGYEILGEEITRKLDEVLMPASRTISLWPKGRIPDFEAAQRVPEMIVTLPENRSTDAFLIVAPGGSYEKLCTWEDERAAWFSARGMATAQLRYRVPRPKGAPKHRAAWQDAQRAVRIVRSHAKEWGVDPEKVGFLGHSAGGHLTVMAAVSSTVCSYDSVDEIDRLPCHVNFAVPCYPAYLVDDDEKIDPAFAFDRATPPICFFHGDADRFSVGSVDVVAKLKSLGMPVELHLFTDRSHADLPWDDFVHLTWEWLKKNAIIQSSREDSREAQRLRGRGRTGRL